jgi:hypothetical protein
LYYLKGKAWKKLTLSGFLFKSLNIVVSIGWAGRGSNPDRGKRDFSFPQRPDGLRGFFLGEGWSQREVRHSPDLVPRLRKREWRYTAAPFIQDYS